MGQAVKALKESGGGKGREEEERGREGEDGGTWLVEVFWFGNICYI